MAIVRRIYERWAENDIDGVLEFVDPDSVGEWARGVPGRDVFHGHEGFRAGWEEWLESWEEFRMHPDEMTARGDEVFVVARYTASGRGSGLPADDRVAHLWQLRDGRSVRLRMFGDVEKARRRFEEG
jgi:hypothetical protein